MRGIQGLDGVSYVLEACPNLLRITAAHKDCCSNENLHNHLANNEIFLLTIPSKANPPNFFPLDTVFHFIQCGFEASELSKGSDFVTSQPPP